MDLEKRLLYTDMAIETEEIRKREDLKPEEKARECTRVRHEYLQKITNIVLSNK